MSDDQQLGLWIAVFWTVAVWLAGVSWSMWRAVTWVERMRRWAAGAADQWQRDRELEKGMREDVEA
ncbi:hypothetical protein [Nocardioides sp.]|uniref:hypothetical protein n=1 Tax=Nocardioides sp. TaxID=35761 RepID=UPI0039E34DCB